MLIKRAGTVVRNRSEEGRVEAFVAHRPNVIRRFEVFADETQYHRVNENKPDLVTFALNAKMHDALTALHTPAASGSTATILRKWPHFFTATDTNRGILFVLALPRIVGAQSMAKGQIVWVPTHFSFCASAL